MERYILLVDNCHGVYIPQEFIKNVIFSEWNIKQTDAQVLLAGIDWTDKISESEKSYIFVNNRSDTTQKAMHDTFIKEFGENYLDSWSEIYWETWDDVLNYAHYENKDGKYRLYLGESGDIFAEKDIDEEELAEYIAKENNLDVDAFREFCANIPYTLGDEYDLWQAVKDFENCYCGEYESNGAFIKEHIQDTGGNILERIVPYVDWDAVFENEYVDTFYSLDLSNGNVAIFYNR